MPEVTHYRTPECPHCKQSSLILIPFDGYKNWRNGEFIQCAFPDLDAEQRELIKTGFHPECWKKYFGSKD